VCDLIQLMMQRNDLMYVGKSKVWDYGTRIGYETWCICLTFMFYS
jgi:hypothetical protein